MTAEANLGVSFFYHRSVAKDRGCTYYVSEIKCEEHGHSFKWTTSGYCMSCHPNTISPVEHTRSFFPSMANTITDARKA